MCTALFVALVAFGVVFRLHVCVCVLMVHGPCVVSGGGRWLLARRSFRAIPTWRAYYTRSIFFRLDPPKECTPFGVGVKSCVVV